MVNPRGGPVEIRLELLAVEHQCLDPVGKLFDRLGGRLAAVHGAAHRAQEFRPHVAVFVDAVAEAHHHALRGKLLFEPGLGPVGRADRSEHLEHLFVGPAVERPLERSDRARDAGVHVGTRRHDRAGCERGGVELMLRVQHERGAEDGHVVGWGRATGEPLQECGGDRAGGPGPHRPTSGEVAPRSEHRRHLPEQPLGLRKKRLARPREHVALDLPEHAHGRAEGVHGRSRRADGREPGQGVDHGRIERAGRGAHPGRERVTLHACGQFAVKEQVGYLLEVSRPGERLDRVAAIAEISFERADRRAAGHDAGQATGEVVGGGAGNGGHGVSCHGCTVRSTASLPPP